MNQSDSTPFAVTIQNLTKKYGSLKALDKITFSVHKGELFALLGPNGAGKTTLVRILTGLTRPSFGIAQVNGQAGLVPQALNLDYDLTVSENLLIHGLLYHMPYPAIGSRIRELLAYTEIAHKARATIRTLSGGMKRRVMIARALMHDPEVLFLDEPTVGLDPHIRRKIWSLIKRVQGQGTTILLTTHYIEEAELLADKVALLDHGTIVALDTPRNLKARMGTYAVDIVDDNGLATNYFPDKESARKAMLDMGEQGRAITLRQVTLEDAVVGLTGRTEK